jgi:hypothetical protein
LNGRSTKTSSWDISRKKAKHFVSIFYIHDTYSTALEKAVTSVLTAAFPKVAFGLVHCATKVRIVNVKETSSHLHHRHHGHDRSHDIDDDDDVENVLLPYHYHDHHESPQQSRSYPRPRKWNTPFEKM